MLRQTQRGRRFPAPLARPGVAIGRPLQFIIGQWSLYGALGLVPLFLMWLNISWMIFFLGAKIAHLLEVQRQGQGSQALA